MRIGYPTYWKRFKCLAGDCPDTCCIGWEIPVEKECLARYRQVHRTNPALGGKLKKHLHNGRIQIKGKTCPFLTEDRLCQLVTALGDGGIGKACRRYPRHREDYGELQEFLLLLSCPEAARLILSEDMKYRVKDLPKRQGDMDGIDGELLEVLIQIREELWKICRRRELSMDRRIRNCLSLAREAQRKVGEGRYEEARKTAAGPSPLSRFLYMADLMELFSGMEQVDGTDESGREWGEILEAARKELYHSDGSREKYGERRKEFREQFPEAELYQERIFFYFLYSFFLAALYDGDIYGKVKMAAACALAAGELVLAEGDGSLKKHVELIHLFARQIENSRENRERLEWELKRFPAGGR